MNDSVQLNPVQMRSGWAAIALAGLCIGILSLEGAVLPSGRVEAQAGFQRITGKTFDGNVPRDFVLESFSIPVEKRNTALLKTSMGSRVLLALLDTSGYTSQVQQKYIGMFITEGKVRICGKPFGTGSYGLGLVKPVPAGPGPAEFRFYDQAGVHLASCAATRDEKLQQPRPLQVLWSGQTQARFYVGRYWVALR